jgi:alpha-mannosidase
MKNLILLLGAMSLSLSISLQGQTDIRKIDRWLIAGPFTTAMTADLLMTPYLDEPGAAPAEGDAAGSSRWKALDASFVDFVRQGFNKTDNCAAYAFTYIYSPRDQVASIRFGSDDGAMIWLNGDRILERPARRSLVENQDTVYIQLPKGWNRLLVKVDQGSGGWETVSSLAATRVKITRERPANPSFVKNPAVAVTRIWVSGITRGNATLSVLISSYGAGSPGGVTCSLVNAGSAVPSKLITHGPAGAVAVFEFPVSDLCRILSKPGAQIRIEGQAGSNEVEIEPDVAMDLFMKIASTAGLADGEMQKSAAAITSAAALYGISPDFSGRARLGLEKIASGRMNEIRPILSGIESSLVDKIPDLRGDSIFVVGHAHMDMNWLWPYHESVKMFQDNFRQVIAFMERFPDYRMLQSQATIYKHIEQLDPPLFEKVKKYVAEGRLELAGGMWTEGDCNLSGGEALCRSFLLGQRYFLDKFGKMARVGWLPDNFGHISQFPQMLKLSGLDYYYFHRCVPFIGPFWWVGPDSSKVLCFTNYTYNGEITPALKDAVAKVSPVTRKMLHPTGIGDHGGGPTLRNIEMIHQLDATPKFPSVKFASAESFFRSTENMPVKLPVHRGEMQFIFEGCYTSVAEIKENTRLSEHSMYSAEFLSSLRWLTGDPYPAGELRDLWETVTFNQFHDILPGSAIYETYQDAVADHKMVQKKANSIFESAFRKLADEIGFKTGAGQPVVALNLQPKAGKVLVQTEIYSHDKPLAAALSGWGDYYEYGHVKPAGGQTAATVMVSDGTGKTYPAQIIGGKAFPPGFRSMVEFVADTMPAGGYRTFYVDPYTVGKSTEAIPEKDGVFETDYFTVGVDLKTGDITGLKDKRTGRQYVSAKGRLNRLMMWMEAPNGMNAWTIGETKDISDITEVVSAAVIERGPVRATIEVVKKWGRSKFIQRTYIYKSYPRIDFDLEAHWFETGDGVHPAPFLKACFDLDFDHPVFNSQVPFDVVSRPATGQEVPAQQWVDVSDNLGGLALLNQTKFGHSLEKGQLRLSLLRATYNPDLYPNIGINHIRYSLFPHAGDWTNGVWAEADQFNIPVYAAEPPSLALVKTHATRPENGSLISLSPSGVVMSGIKQAEDGKNLIIRLVEVTGKEALAEVTLPVKVDGARLVNIIEFPVQSAAQPVVSGNTVRVRLKGHEIVTLEVTSDK